MTGVSNKGAAAFLMKYAAFAQKGLQGVMYFDVELDCWMILEFKACVTKPRSKCSMMDKDTFIIFDDARTRGADMKMSQGAVAMVTLGPQMTKDKFMQGVGRLRKFGHDQKIVLAFTTETWNDIGGLSNDLQIAKSVILVMEWIMNNTKNAIERGLLEWAMQGSFYARSKESLESNFQEENWDLEQLYSSSEIPCKITDVLNEFQPCKDQVFVRLMTNIKDHVRLFGETVIVSGSSKEEQSEKEMEKEAEMEAEKELEAKREVPFADKSWNYNAVLQAKSPYELGVKIRHFSSSVSEMPHLKQINWANCKVFGTENFWSTIENQATGKFDPFIRFVDAILLFQSGELLCLSDREADHVLKALWSNKANYVTFANYSYVRQLIDIQNVLDKPRLAVPASKGSCDFGGREMVSVEVLNGETMFGPRLTLVDDLLRLMEDRSRVVEIVSSRGQLHCWACSELEECSTKYRES
jgi:hypothetical protein